jgi:hypothetical protein
MTDIMIRFPLPTRAYDQKAQAQSSCFSLRTGRKQSQVSFPEPVLIRAQEDATLARQEIREEFDFSISSARAAGRNRVNMVSDSYRHFRVQSRTDPEKSDHKLKAAIWRANEGFEAFMKTLGGVDEEQAEIPASAAPGPAPEPILVEERTDIYVERLIRIEEQVVEKSDTAIKKLKIHKRNERRASRKKT